MRVAIWQDGKWVEIEVQHFEESKHSGGRALSIIGTLELAPVAAEPVVLVASPAEILTPMPAVMPSPAEERTIESGRRANRARARMRAATSVEPIAPVPPLPIDPPEPQGGLDQSNEPPVNETSTPPAPPTWGGRDPKDVDGETKAPKRETVRFFTVELLGGKVMTNQCTAKGRSVAEAEAIVRSTWTKLGKPVGKITYQPSGRVGEDTPVVKVSVAVDEDAEPEQPTVPAVDEGPSATFFRWDRATLAESVKTAVPCHTLSKLIEILRSREGLEAVTADEVKVEFWSYDERIDWNTYSVTAFGSLVGLTNGPL